MIILPDNWIDAKLPYKQGGQGIVYFVYKKAGNDKKLFALKMLKNANKAKPRERFITEIKAIQEIGHHENIIRIYENIDIDNPTGYYYYVMEVAEISLQDLIYDKNQCSMEEYARIFLGVCNGVKYIHSKHIIHRDIKPQNILFVNKVPKIADLGLCLFLDQSKRNTDLKERVGPIHYMAPELEDGLNLDVDYKADIYSLGKLLYFMLSGGTIFSREKYDSKEYKLVNIKCDERYNVFDEFFSKTITYQKDKRYSNIENLIDGFSNAYNNFQNKPYTMLIMKEPNFFNLIEKNELNFIDDLGDTEIGALFQYLLNTNKEISSYFFERTINRINESNVILYQKLIYRNQNNISHETLKQLLLSIYSSDNLYSIKDGINELFSDAEFRRMFKLIAIDTGDERVINNIASDLPSRLMFSYEVEKDVLFKLIKNFYKIRRIYRIGILSEMSRGNIQLDDKDVFYETHFSYIMKNDFILIEKKESLTNNEQIKLILEELGYVLGKMENMPSLDDMNKIVNVLNVLSQEEITCFIGGIYNNPKLISYLKDNLNDKVIVVALKYLLNASIEE